MKIIISPKDNSNKLLLEDVETFMPEGETLGVVFKDGRRRNYPFCHIWWYGEDNPTNKKRTKPKEKNDELDDHSQYRVDRAIGHAADEIMQKFQAGHFRVMTEDKLYSYLYETIEKELTS